MISILGFLAVYFSIRKPTEDERHGARPPAVRIATFAYIGDGFRARGGGRVGSGALGSRRRRDGADLQAHLPAFRRMCVSCKRRPSDAFAAASSAGPCNGAARAVPLVRGGRGNGGFSMLSPKRLC